MKFKLPEGWEIIKLKLIATVRGGKRMPKGKMLTKKKTPYPYIRVRDFNQNKDLQLNNTFEFVPKTVAEDIKNYTVREKDIIIFIVGTVGNVAKIGRTLDGANLTENCVRLHEFSSEIDSSYLYYYLISPLAKEEINKGTVGAVQKKLPIKNIRQMNVVMPSLSEQKAIADTLSALDEKIETNNKINKNLEAQAQALFKHWFVDFEFPNEHGEPYQSSGGKMVESELGIIPEGFRVVKLSDSLKVELGGTPARKKAEYWGGDINWINSGELNSYRITSPTETITEKGLQNSSTKLWPENTTVIAITGATLGQTSLLLIDTCANQSVVGIKENNEIPYTFVYPFILSRVPELIGHQTGGAQQHINRGNIANLDLLVPDKDLLGKYHELVKSYYKTIKNNEIENQQLAEIRDTLLPKLMSGELRVPLD